jgi:hypothetical protein
MFLLFDLSTNGKPKNWKAHFTDTFSWPKLLHIAWLLYDKKGNLTEEGNCLINPLAMELDPTAMRLAGLDEEQLRTEGVEVKKALNEFCSVVRGGLWQRCIGDFQSRQSLHFQKDRHCLGRAGSHLSF